MDKTNSFDGVSFDDIPEDGEHAYSIAITDRDGVEHIMYVEAPGIMAIMQDEELEGYWVDYFVQGYIEDNNIDALTYENQGCHG